MTTVTHIHAAGPLDAPEVAEMTGALLGEIMAAIGVQVFNFDQAATVARLEDFLAREKSFVFVARDDDYQPLGFIAMYEGHALYAEGAFGTIAELYVQPAYRGVQVGRELVLAARRLASARHWTRLEVTTPPLPHFGRTLAFYEREGFAISGGRKLKSAV
ncbi:MAG: GNAT family N-acetyltransferase [Massilia sp.]